MRKGKAKLILWLNSDELRAELRRACDRLGSQLAWANANGFSAAYISDVLSGKREVSAELASRLGYTRKVVFEKVAE